MKAAILYGKADVRVEEIPAPALKPGEVRVAIRAALTCGTDLKVYKRGYHAKMIVPPATFGHELAGVIEEVGPGVSGWSLGDRVVAANSAPCGACFHCRCDQENLCEDLLFLNGAYAQSIVIPARLVEKNLLKLKGGTGFREAALTEPLACVVQGLRDTDVRAGQQVLVLGAGPIGLMFVALLRHLGCRVTVAGRHSARMQAAARLGAARVVDIAEGHNLVARIKEQAPDRFDAVIEAVGKPEVWEAAVHLVRKGGAVNFFGGCPSGTSVTFDTTLIHYSNLRLLASFHHTPSTIRQALGYIEAGVIRGEDFISGECPLSGLPGLLAEMAQGNRAVKTLIQVDR